MSLVDIFKRSDTCRHHWHSAVREGEAGWSCCWCADMVAAGGRILAPRSLKHECLAAETMATWLPPARSTDMFTRGRRQPRRRVST